MPEFKEDLHFSERDFDSISKIAYELTGIKISTSRRGTLTLRISDRMRATQKPRLADYLDFVKVNATERDLLISLFTINETRFFRERSHLRHLFHETIPELARRYGSGRPIKVLSAACSTGEEAYSLAIMLDQFSERVKPIQFSIDGVDVDRKALALASRGIYSIDAKKNIPHQLFHEYFEEGVGLASGYLRVCGEIKNRVRFTYRNLLAHDFTYNEYDIIFCKNVFIYFDQSTIHNILDSFSGALSSSGTLYLGMSEAIHRTTEGLVRIEGCIYRKSESKNTHTTLPPKSNRKYSVLIIDDSKAMQQLLAKVVNSTNYFEVKGIASGVEAAEKLLESDTFDAVTLDLEMPGLDGLDFLKRRLGKQSLPVLVVSSLSASQSTKVLDALEAGAFDYQKKPSMEGRKEFSDELERKLLTGIESQNRSISGTVEKHDEVVFKRQLGPDLSRTSRIACIAIGASTGGTEAIRALLPGLPAGLPPILIAQHIPPVFSRAFAERLNRECSYEVVEAADGMKLEWGRAYVAAGGKHMTVVKKRQEAEIKLLNVRKDLHFTPSVDLLFESLASLFPYEVCGVLLTGMGKDGAQGMLSIKNSGGVTIAQDKATSVVYGMPKEAVLLGAATSVLPITKIANEIMNVIVNYRGKNDRYRQSA